MPTLYVAPGACSFGAHVALKAAGLSHQIEVVPLRTPDSPIHKVNPLGRVPTLVTDNGQVVTENGAILPYIASLNPEAGLGGRDALEQARIQEWIGFVNSDLHVAFRNYNRPNLLHPNDAVQAEIKAQAKERLYTLLAVIDSRVPDGAWLVGGRFTVADAYLGTFTRWVTRAELDWSRWPRLRAYADRFDAHPAVAQASAAEQRA